MPERIKDWGLAPDLGQCRLCGSSAGQRYFWAEVYAGSGQALRRCGYCAGVYLAPGFTDAGLTRFYQGPYRRLFPAEVPWRDKARFFAWRGDRDIARQRLGLIEPALAAGARLFELGSGFGAFLGQAGRSRPDLALVASEPDSAHRGELLDGAPVRFVDNLPAVQPASVDAVVAFHVLEHLPDPLGFFQQAGEALREGGQLWVEVPDLMAAWNTRLFVHPAHLSYFCADALRRLAEASGLQVISCGQHPLAALEGTLWLHARRPERLAETPVRAAAQATVVAVDHWIERVGWGLRDRLKNFGKRRVLGLLGAGLVGELQRWRQYRARLRQERTP